MDLVIISLKINLFSPWYTGSWKIAELVLNNNQSLTHILKIFFTVTYKELRLFAHARQDIGIAFLTAAMTALIIKFLWLGQFLIIIQPRFTILGPHIDHSVYMSDFSFRSCYRHKTILKFDDRLVGNKNKLRKKHIFLLTIQIMYHS